MTHLLAPLLFISAVAQQEPNYVLVASLEPAEIPARHALNVLSLGGVSALTVGSRGYGVLVETQDKAKAEAILAKDALRHPYMYIHISGYSGALGAPDEKTWTRRYFGVDLDKADSYPAFTADKNLLGLAIETKTRLQEPSAYIKDMQLFSASYVDDQGKERPAYKAVVNVRYRNRSGSYTLRMWSWDGQGTSSKADSLQMPTCHLASFLRGTLSVQRIEWLYREQLSAD